MVRKEKVFLVHNDSKAILLSPGITKRYGIVAAIIIQQVHFISNNKKQLTFVDGRYWVGKTINEWVESLGLYKYDAIKRTLSKLVKEKALFRKELSNYNSDRTGWYSVNYEKINEECYNGLKCHTPSQGGCHPDLEGCHTSSQGDCHTLSQGAQHTRSLKIKSLKDKSLKDKSNKIGFISVFPFSEFWLMYSRPADEYNCKQLYDTLTEEIRALIKKNLPGYLGSFNGQNYRKSPLNWLIAKNWVDDYSTDSTSEPSMLDKYGAGNFS